jgi:hypothetical protein
MWGTRTLERARRRFAGGSGVSNAPSDVAAGPTAPSRDGQAGPETTVSVALSRPDKDRFTAELAARLGAETRLDTPARVASALTVAIERVGGRGQPLVVRNPAGLYTPEYWHISIHGADDLTRAEIERLAAPRRTEP